MKRPMIVVTPVMNAVAFINETIRSVVGQSGDFLLRYHIQDGGSSDGTVELLRKWESRLNRGNSSGGAEIKFSWISEPDRGMYQGINRGFSFVESEFANGDWNVAALTWINADDILLANSLKTAFN